MKPNGRLLSIAEVNALLPEIEAIVRRVEEMRKKHEGLHDALLMNEILSDAERERGVQAVHSSIEKDAQELEAALVELENDISRIRDLGGIIRSLEAGWVDFPGQHQGQTIHFSWKLGEKTIQYYYAQNGRLTDRQPIR